MQFNENQCRHAFSISNHSKQLINQLLINLPSFTWSWHLLLLKKITISSVFHFMNIATRAILINLCSGNLGSSTRKCTLFCIQPCRKISNVSGYKFTSIAVYKLIYPKEFHKGVSIETIGALLDLPLIIINKNHHVNKFHVI